MKEEIVERVLGSVGGGDGSEHPSEESPPLGIFVGYMAVLLIPLSILMWQNDVEIWNFDVSWMIVWAIIAVGGGVAALTFWLYVIPRFGLVSLPIGLGLAAMDVFVVFPYVFAYVLEEFISPMQFAAYPDILPAFLAFQGAVPVTGTLALLAFLFIAEGINAAVPTNWRKVDE